MNKTLLFTFIICGIFYKTTAQIGFQPYTIIDQGSTNGPTAVFAADLDGDGHLDLVSTSEYDNKVAWYKNDGAGNLGTQQIISMDVISPKAAHAADFDNDGNIDLLISSAKNSRVVWFRNDGFARFGSPRLITSNVNGISNSLAADINGDGDMDVVATSADDNKIIWFENLDGQGTFGPENIITTTVERAIKIATSDLDGDGDLDLIASTIYDDKTVWFENLDGQGSFGQEQLIDDEASPIYALYGFDIDADGDNDIVMNKDSTLIYYENLNGQGNFSTAQTITPDNVYYFLLKDFDQDGDLDIVANVENKIAWYENLDGQGNFANKETLVDENGLINLADINGNGRLDILTAYFAQDKIAWYSSNNQGMYGNEIIISIIDGAQNVYSVQAADIDGDGYMDAISANMGVGTITWFKNTDGQGNFGEPRIIGENIEYVQSISVVDIDGDGDMDVVSSSDENNFATWYKNIDGQGNFVAQPPFSTDFISPVTVTADDLDGDGDMDVIVFDFSMGMRWFENLDGLGSFGSAQTIDGLISYTESIHTVDIDGDGDKDIINASYEDYLFVWYENLDGQGNFGGRNIIEENVTTPTAIYFADLDGDGDMDILGSSAGEDSVMWYENTDGLGNFGPRNTITNTSPSPWNIKTLDVDQDGDMDVFVVDYSDGTVSWYENTDGLGTFGSQQLVDLKMRGAQTLAVADFNNNGKLDVLAGAYYGDKLSWYDNFGRLGNTINGLVTLDLDTNGCTSNDAPMRQIMVVTDNGSNSFATFTQPNGEYQLYTNEGTFTTALNSELPYYYSPTPSSHTSTFVGQDNSDSGDFCVVPTETINDLNITFYPISDARPGFVAEYQIVFNNVGSTILDGVITLGFDDVRLNFLTASEPIGSQTNNTLTFNYATFKPFETRSIDISFQVATPPTTQIGDVLVYDLTITPIAGDLTEADNTFTFEQTVIGSFDPNDIQVLEGESIFLDEADNYLHYIIRFQNMGTASAINVTVNNELDPNLDWSTLQIENISHSNRVEITNGNQVEYIFNNINLPDATSNEPESHGYIQYKIKPKSTITVGDFMMNNAAIYFDFNLPVLTNTVITTVIRPLGIEENAVNSVVLYPVPSSDVLNIRSAAPITDVKVFNNLGQLVFIQSNPNGIQVINIEQLREGMYFMRLTDIDRNSRVRKFIKSKPTP